MTDPTDDEIARQRCAEIRAHLEGAWDLLAIAYTEGDWLTLGYSTWSDYLIGEYPIRPQLARADRPEVFAQLAAAGMSRREIAASTGVSHPTVGKVGKEVLPRSTSGKDLPEVDLEQTDAASAAIEAANAQWLAAVERFDAEKFGPPPTTIRIPETPDGVDAVIRRNAEEFRRLSLRARDLDRAFARMTLVCVEYEEPPPVLSNDGLLKALTGRAFALHDTDPAIVGLLGLVHRRGVLDVLAELERDPEPDPDDLPGKVRRMRFHAALLEATDPGGADPDGDTP